MAISFATTSSLISLLDFLPTFFGWSHTWGFYFALFLIRIRSTEGGGGDGIWMGEEMRADALDGEGDLGEGKSYPDGSKGFGEVMTGGVVFIGGIGADS